MNTSRVKLVSVLATGVRFEAASMCVQLSEP